MDEIIFLKLFNREEPNVVIFFFVFIFYVYVQPFRLCTRLESSCFSLFFFPYITAHHDYHLLYFLKKHMTHLLKRLHVKLRVVAIMEVKSARIQVGRFRRTTSYKIPPLAQFKNFLSNPRNT